MFGVHRNGDNVISELCYKGQFYKRNYREMTIEWSFSYNSICKIQWLKNLGCALYPNKCYKEVCYKGTALYIAKWDPSCNSYFPCFC